MPPALKRLLLHPLTAGLALLGLKAAWEYAPLFALGDTFQAYAFFATCLGNLKAAGELPLWLPHAAWGIPAAPYLLCFLGPFQTLCLLAAWAVGAGDAWTPFFCSVLLDQAWFVATSFLLARELYGSHLARLGATLGAVLLLYWQAQYFWPFKMIVHLPLLLFLLLRFQRGGNPVRLWQAGLAALAFLCGNLAYAAPVLAMLGLVFLAGLALFSRGWPPVRASAWLSRRSLAWLAGLAALAGVYGRFLAGSLDGVEILAPGRGPDGRVSLDMFLDYGQRALSRLPDFFLGQPVGDLEMNVYLGAAAVGLIGLGLAGLLRPGPGARRNPALAALALTALFLLLLSLGRDGLVGYAASHFPLADRFRHLGHLLPLVRVLGLFLAGFGLEALARDPDQARAWRRAALFGLGAALLFLGVKWGVYGRLVPKAGLNPAPEAAAVVLALGLLAAARFQAKGRAAGTVLCLALVLELGLSHQALITDLQPLLLPPPPGVDLRAVRAPAFHGQRLADPAGNPSDGRGWVAVPYLAATRWPVNTTLFEFLGLDPCLPLFRTDFVCRDLARRGGPALRAALDGVNRERGPRGLLDARHWEAVRAEGGLLTSCGCGGPKLFLSVGPPTAPVQDLAPQVGAFSANRLSLAVEHPNPAGATLVYGDAFHPGWRAFVDGRAVPLVLAGGAVKALFLPPGRHRVEFVFGRDWERAAVPVLGLGLAACLGLMLLAGLTRPEEGEAPEPTLAP
jgi:hypothetical protein